MNNTPSTTITKLARWVALATTLALYVLSFASETSTGVVTSESKQSRGVAAGRVAEGTTVPFSLVNNHVVLPVSINHSRPLSFVLDTGDQFAIVNLEVAKSLGLRLRGQVRVGGAGADVSTGAFVDNANFTIFSLPEFSQPVSLALPIGHLASRLGQDFDGIIGADFIQQFILELDYQKKLLTFHDKANFKYSGNGASIPVQLIDGHPILTATVSPLDRPATSGKFVLDIGSGLALAIYSPFVREHHLLDVQTKTIQLLGGAGAGGETTGRFGRVRDLSIGPYTFRNPITLFSQDKAGAFSSAALVGNIGARIAMRFRLFFDYDKARIIFEPNSSFEKPFEYAFSGLSLLAEGPNYRMFRVSEVLNDSPATLAGIQKDDVINEIDGTRAEALSLSVLNEMLERPRSYNLKITRGSQTLQVRLTPKLLV